MHKPAAQCRIKVRSVARSGMAANKVTAVRLGLGRQPTVRDYQAAIAGGFFSLIPSGGVRPCSFTGLTATLLALAAPFGTISRLPQRRNGLRQGRTGTLNRGHMTHL